MSRLFAPFFIVVIVSVMITSCRNGSYSIACQLVVVRLICNHTPKAFEIEPFACMASFIESLQHPTGLGIISGLVRGKFIGISGACWIGLRYNIGCLPNGVKQKLIVSVSGV